MVTLMSEYDEYQAWKGSTSDRRRWDRHPPRKGTVAHVEGRSYRLMDISRGGFAIYDYGDESVPEEVVVSLHSMEEGFFIDALKCRKMSDQKVVSDSPYGRSQMNRVGLMIVDNDPELGDKLTPFLAAL